MWTQTNNQQQNQQIQAEKESSQSTSNLEAEREQKLLDFLMPAQERQNEVRATTYKPLKGKFL